MNDIIGKNIALIVAAGSGQRSGQSLPKQYAEIDGKPMLTHSVQSFATHNKIDAIYIVIGEDQEAMAVKALSDMKIEGYIIGGKTRQISVFNGLKKLSGIDNINNILIHDAARPYLPHDVIDRLLQALQKEKAAIAVLPVSDTIAHIDNELMQAPANRDAMARVQTPQAFHFQHILQAHEKAKAAQDQNYSDDSQIMHAMGYNVAIVQGDTALHKYTYSEDFMSTTPSLNSNTDEHIQNIPHFRIGSGFDVHRFGKGEELWLGGVKIEHHSGLIGHSDADIVLHTLTDALLGALAMGDIGDHFPPSDPQWKSASSDIFMKHACALAEDKGYKIANTDITIMCEAPKIGPHRDVIRQSIASILSVSLDQISLKATTTEKLGFTGRGEGMAVQAQILIEKRV